jgi:Oxysterol-binding protein
VKPPPPEKGMATSPQKIDSSEASQGEEESKRSSSGLMFKAVTEGEEEYVLGVEDEEEIFLDAQEELILVSPQLSQSSSFVCQITDVEGERLTLPHLRHPNQKISFWKILKEVIGKDLSKVSLPVYFNEPLSMT